jgi:hypothetical protein
MSIHSDPPQYSFESAAYLFESSYEELLREHCTPSHCMNFTYDPGRSHPPLPVPWYPLTVDIAAPEHTSDGTGLYHFGRYHGKPNEYDSKHD